MKEQNNFYWHSLQNMPPWHNRERLLYVDDEYILRNADWEPWMGLYA